MLRSPHLWILGLALVAAAPASGNRIENGGFDDGLAGWSGAGSFSDFDLGGDPASGSVLVAGGQSLGQCVDIRPNEVGAAVEASASIFVPSPLPLIVFPFPAVIYFDQEDCGGPGLNSFLPAPFVPVGEVVVFEPPVSPVPVEARSARFILGFLNTSPGDPAAHFDEVIFSVVPEPSIALLAAAVLVAGARLPARRRLP